MKIVKTEAKMFRIRYECEHCGYSASESEVQNHIASEHSYVEKKDFSEDYPSFYRFENEEQFKRFTDRPYYRGKEWEGPGWYFPEGKDDPCPRGCCWDYVTEVQHIKHLAKRLKEELENKQALHDLLVSLLPKETP